MASLSPGKPDPKGRAFENLIDAEVSGIKFHIRQKNMRWIYEHFNSEKPVSAGGKEPSEDRETVGERAAPDRVESIDLVGNTMLELLTVEDIMALTDLSMDQFMLMFPDDVDNVVSEIEQANPQLLRTCRKLVKLKEAVEKAQALLASGN